MAARLREEGISYEEGAGLGLQRLRFNSSLCQRLLL